MFGKAQKTYRIVWCMADDGTGTSASVGAMATPSIKPIPFDEYIKNFISAPNMSPQRNMIALQAEKSSGRLLCFNRETGWWLLLSGWWIHLCHQSHWITSNWYRFYSRRGHAVGQSTKCNAMTDTPSMMAFGCGWRYSFDNLLGFSDWLTGSLIGWLIIRYIGLFSLFLSHSGRSTADWMCLDVLRYRFLLFWLGITCLEIAKRNCSPQSVRIAQKKKEVISN